MPDVQTVRRTASAIVYAARSILRRWLPLKVRLGVGLVGCGGTDLILGGTQDHGQITEDFHVRPERQRHRELIVTTVTT